MTESSGRRATDRPGSDHAPVLAAVDGSDPNHAAVLWAAAEAAREGADLILVAVADEHHLRHFGRGISRGKAEHALTAAREAVTGLVEPERLSSQVLTGDVDETLLGEADRVGLLVVGKRGQHAIPRLLVGSTSLAVAGACPAPTTVVPDSWAQSEHEGHPIVVGVQPDQTNERLLDLAFGRAGRFGVPLVAVHGQEHPEEPPADPAPESRGLEEELRPWRERFPDVEVRLVESQSHPAMAVLDASEQAQLVVLGRHKDSRFSGFGFGSVTRAVLHYTACPVLVVPADDD